MTESPLAARLLGATVAHRGRPVWSGVDLDIASGEFLVVLGPNGAGKSTLLQVLLGLHPLSAGRVEVLGGPPRHARGAVGYVPQRRALDPDIALRARDLVGLGVDGHRFGVATPAAARRRRATVDATLEAVGAAAYADRPAGLLSGGEQQRLLLAQALVGEPRLLLLDEPLGGLDLRSQGIVSRLVAEVSRARGITVVLVAHDVNPLLGVLDRVAYVAGGTIAAGSPDEVITSERLTALYDVPVEVIRDRHGRVAVIGADEHDSHHLGHDHR